MEAAFDQEFCTTFGLLPVRSDELNRLQVLVTASSDLSVVDYLRCRCGLLPELCWVTPEEFQMRLAAAFTGSRTPGKQPSSLAEYPDTDSQIVTQVSRIIRESIDSGASDIHFEPAEHEVRCRARIDGALVDRHRLPRDYAAELLSRLKIMARLDIAEKRRLQDGRIRFEHGGRVVDIRVSVIPTDFGEKAVLRLLDKQTLRLDLATLGFAPGQQTTFVQQIEAPNGIVLVTGPTGSGKTTTLYAALNHLRSPEVNICTVEDPIEYNLHGITQTQIRPDIDVTFAGMLRSLLRQDPDIIMVGEIRDRETLDIAIRAAMTGHLVLSTLHTNSALATVARLLDMGAEPFLLASSLRLVVAQRLVRRNCSTCFIGELSTIEQEAADRLNMTIGSSAGQGTGCTECGNTGFRGRVAIYELLVIDDTLREAIFRRAPEHELRILACKLGFCTMAQTAHALIDHGVTTPGEVLREIHL